jgi:hypothetical protein
LFLYFKMWSRAEKLMDTWADRGLISESGKAFLIATLDPFHDAQIQNLAGYPDIETSPSLVRMVKQSITITKPAGLPAGDWDAQIVCWPWMKQMGFQKTTVRSNNVITGLAACQQLGGLQVLACPSSVGNFDLDLATTIAAGKIEIADDILQGSNRLIGAGFEVHNTTAEIYKQGACLSYMMHNVPKDASLFIRPATVNPPPAVNTMSTAFNGTSMRNFPRTTAEALLIPGSVEWDAAQGVYAVCRFAGVENPPYTVNYNLPVIFEIDDIPSSPVSSAPSAYPTYPNTSAVLIPAGSMDQSIPSSPAWKSFPIHTSGVILSGLSEQTSLRVNFNVIVENFPGPRDVKDLTIATPSASFDPRTLEIYSHVLGHAPVAVPVGENPLGEWFMDMVKNVSTAIGLIPHPIAKGISMVGGLVGDTFKDYMTTPSGGPVVKTIKAKPQKVKTASKPAIQQKAPKLPANVYTNAAWMKLTKAQRASIKKRGPVTIRG